MKLKLAVKANLLFLLLFVPTVTTNASKIIDHVVSGTGAVGNGWIDTWGQYTTTSGAIVSTKTVATIGSTTVNGATTAGTNVIVYTSATSRVVGEVDIVGAGTANAEALQIQSIAGTSITFTTNTVNNHSNGESIVRQRDAPLLRPSSENVLNNSQYVKTAALPATSYRPTLAFLRYVDNTDYVKIVGIWNGSTTFQVQVFHCLQGVETSVSSTNWAASSTNVIECLSSASGTNPTTITYTVYRVSAGLHIPLTVSGNSTGRVSSTITTGTNSVIQSAGQCGIAAADTGTGFTQIYTENNTNLSVAISNANFQAGLSPYATHITSTTSVESNDIDWHSKFTFSGSNCTLLLDLSGLQASAGSSTIIYSVDERAFVSTNITNATTSIVLMSSGLWNSAHTVRIYWRSQFGGGTADLWTANPPPSIIKITGINIDTGETIGAYALLSKRLLWYSDSIALNPADGIEGTSIPSPYYNHVEAVAKALGCEVGLIPMGGQGFRWLAAYNVPALFVPGDDTNSAWNKHWAGVSRLVSGAFSPAPDYIVVNEGTNDWLHGTSDANVVASVAAFIPALRAAAPLAKIIFLQPIGGDFKWTQVKQGVVQAADSNTIAVDLPSYVTDGVTAGGQDTWASGDGIHQNTAKAAIDVNPAIVSAINSALNPSVSIPVRTHYRFNTSSEMIFNTLKKTKLTY